MRGLRGRSNSESNVSNSDSTQDGDNNVTGKLEEEKPKERHRRQDRGHDRKFSRTKRQTERQHSRHCLPLERVDNKENLTSTEDVENVDPSRKPDVQREEYSTSDPTTELKEIYPGEFADDYKDLLLMEKTVEIFLSSLGVRGSLRMGATSFRNFTR